MGHSIKGLHFYRDSIPDRGDKAIYFTGSLAPEIRDCIFERLSVCVRLEADTDGDENSFPQITQNVFFAIALPVWISDCHDLLVSDNHVKGMEGHLGLSDFDITEGLARAIFLDSCYNGNVSDRVIDLYTDVGSEGCGLYLLNHRANIEVSNV